MALTPIQRDVCRLLAASRIASGESYVAGGVALNVLLDTGRLSRDIDLFHDTDEALDASWDRDRRVLVDAGFAVTVIRERPAFVEARVGRDDDTVVVEWARDSAYRFFPLVEHAELGLVLHPFDLATNKVLALVGRLEPRDWIDVLACDERLQPLGYLAWAAAGKDPGFTPDGILAAAARSGRYSAEEIGALDFADRPPDVRALAVRWHAILAEAQRIVAQLPASEVGRCVLEERGELCRLDATALAGAVAAGSLQFRRGSIRGALPTIKS